MMGIEDIDVLKPTFQIELFPDGTHEAFLVGTDGETIGRAVVTFKDGKWTADLKMSSEVAKDLGLNLTVVHSRFRNAETIHLVAHPIKADNKMVIPVETEIKNVRVSFDASTQRFFVPLDVDTADKLKDEGWDVRYAGPESFLWIAVNAKRSVEILKGLVDLTIEPYVWKVNGRSGIKAFIKSMKKADS